MSDMDEEELQDQGEEGDNGGRHMEGPPDEHTLRIAIASDCHLGYLENDLVRRDDSFNAFEEILKTALDEQCDFVLLGGDLFHDNKPSRYTLYRTMQIFRKYVLGDRPVRFEVVSDQTINFPDTKCVNYEDENFNIALPVFSIHGNHDDPAGVGSYSAVDLLSSGRFLNYFGKAERVEDITNYPILIEKGDTKLALYGLGNIRDDRLHRTFKANNVKWVRAQQDKDAWFNLLAIHQNRITHSASQKNYISEKMLPPFLDFILWGHEHECLINPEVSEEHHFFVSQPGSSIATSLSAGEAKQKQFGILEVRLEQHRLVPVPFETVRPFAMGDTSLADHLDPFEGDDPAKVADALAREVEKLISAVLRGLPPNTLPLVRLRVDHTGFPKINISRFGQQFVGRVANPEDVIIFTKTRSKPSGKRNSSNANNGAIDEDEGDLMLRAGVDERPPIHDLVEDMLTAAGSMSILGLSGIGEAVMNFVDKRDNTAIDMYLSDTLEKIRFDLDDEKLHIECMQDVELQVRRYREADDAEHRRQRRRAELGLGSDDSDPEDFLRGADSDPNDIGGRGRHGPADDNHSSLDEAEQPQQPVGSSRQARRERASDRASGRGRRTRGGGGGDDASGMMGLGGSQDSMMTVSTVASRRPRAARGREDREKEREDERAEEKRGGAGGRSRPRAGQAAAIRKQINQLVELSSGAESDDWGQITKKTAKKATKKPAKSTGGRKKAAAPSKSSKSRVRKRVVSDDDFAGEGSESGNGGRSVEEIEDDSDNDDKSTVISTARGAGGRNSTKPVKKRAKFGFLADYNSQSQATASQVSTSSRASRAKGTKKGTRKKKSLF